jgi:hypothetical protein
MKTSASRAYRSALDNPTQTAKPALVQSEPEPQPMGRFFIHDYAPIRGERIDEAGRTTYLVQCFPIAADATPGKVRETVFEGSDAQYFRYFGHISRRHGEDGLTAGYVYDCYGVPAGFQSAPDITDLTMTRADMACYSPPRARRDIMAPFGNYQGLVTDTDGTIAVMAAVEAARYPKKDARKRLSL